MYELELTTLAKAKVRFVVVGGIAVCLHGHGRTTFDLDIVTDMAVANIKRLLATLGKLGYRPRLPVSAESLLDKKQVAHWVKERHLQAFTFIHSKDPTRQVDILLDPPVSYSKLVKGAKRIKVNGAYARIASPRHLVLMKTRAGRTHDRQDIVFLKRIMDETP